MSYKEATSVISRPASTSLLAISSKDRFKNYVEERAGTSFSDEFNGAERYNFSPYNFTITRPESLMNGFLTRLAVTEFRMDWMVPNVNLYTNSIIVQYQVGANPVQTTTLYFGIGFYTPYEFAAIMQTKLRAISALTTASFAYSTNASTSPGIPVFAYSSGSTTTIAFLPQTTDTTTNITYPASQRQLFDMLGFNDDNKILVPSGSGIGTFFNYTDYVDIVSPQLTYNQPLKDTMSQPISRDSLCRVYLNQISGSLNANTLPAYDPGFTPPGSRPFQIYHNFTHPKEINWTPNQPVPGNLTFQVYDSSGQILSPLAGSGNWSMTLLVTEN